MGALSSTVTIKLAKMLPLLASDQDGEVVATAAAIGRVLAGAGASWHDVAALLSPVPPAKPVPSNRERSSTAFSFAHLELEGVYFRILTMKQGTKWTAHERRLLAEVEEQLLQQPPVPLSRFQAEILTGMWCDQWGVSS